MEGGRQYKKSGSARITWTSELKTAFLAAIDKLGGPEKVTPKLIHGLVDSYGLSLSQVKSHLQLHRISLKDPSEKSTPKPKVTKARRQVREDNGGSNDPSPGQVEPACSSQKRARRSNNLLESRQGVTIINGEDPQSHNNVDVVNKNKRQTTASENIITVQNKNRETAGDSHVSQANKSDGQQELTTARNMIAQGIMEAVQDEAEDCPLSLCLVPTASESSVKNSSVDVANLDLSI